MGDTTPLADLETICSEVFDRWDKDMRPGKLLGALCGHPASGYSTAVDRVRMELAATPARLELIASLEGDVEALVGLVAKRDAAVANCPYAKPNPPSSDSPCRVCGADSTEPCRKRVIADGEFFDAAKEAIVRIAKARGEA